MTTKTLSDLKRNLKTLLAIYGIASPTLLEAIKGLMDEAYLLGAVDETESIGESIDAVKEGGDGTKE